MNINGKWSVQSIHHFAFFIDMLIVFIVMIIQLAWLAKRYIKLLYTTICFMLASSVFLQPRNPRTPRPGHPDPNSRANRALPTHWTTNSSRLLLPEGYWVYCDLDHKHKNRDLCGIHILDIGELYNRETDVIYRNIFFISNFDLCSAWSWLDLYVQQSLKKGACDSKTRLEQLTRSSFY